MERNDETHDARLAAKIDEAAKRITALETAIEEIGQPAARDLRRRLDALKVEERALRRNFHEAVGAAEDHGQRIAKVEKLLAHIEREETSVEREAAFLHQSPPSTIVLAAEAGAKVIHAVNDGARKLFNGKAIEKSSVFVNHTHKTLVERYGLQSAEREAKTS